MRHDKGSQVMEERSKQIRSPERLIRPATPDEAGLLHALTGRSILSWGYPPAFLDWEPEAIAVTPDFIARSHVYVLEEAGTIVGYYALTGDPDQLSLDKLFVEPRWIGAGCGKQLWLHALETARSLGASEFTLFSDPNAAPFYRAMGAVWQREEVTSWPDWNLQVFHVPLSTQAPASPNA
jgi:GNAT superfamily N-acetyltransferase